MYYTPYNDYSVYIYFWNIQYIIYIIYWVWSVIFGRYDVSPASGGFKHSS